MDMQEFIENNRTELSNAIWRVVPNCPIDDNEIEMWINNDEGLYNWAYSEGVFDEDEEEDEEEDDEIEEAIDSIADSIVEQMEKTNKKEN